ncbi:thioredoxin [Deinococcus humi]|uniref:Glutaredoxin n=1 Tax=Deinococcus humi TaxID=662880 RepID=A0A7W8JW26_9DEIO|nr:thioredoxin [Deinococcus humi]MBB5363893.1 glutaredoxin [Deinococcus humi]GGO31612.1 thioredoxin [Deinococcus humi]
MTDAQTPPFVLLTQDDCPNCERLKLMLEKPLRGQFDSQIEVVHRQQHAAAFTALSESSGVQSTPVLIHRASGRVLVNTGGLGEVRGFLTAQR